MNRQDVHELLLVIAHLPFAVVEGVILGFVVGFLAKVKPEMLGIARGSLNHGGHEEIQDENAAFTTHSSH